MNFTLYCYGDIELFSGGLRAVAMLFDPVNSAIVGESGLQIGSLTALALLISLGGIAITGISRQRVNVDHLLVLVLVFGVMFIPKTDLNIEDVISGKVDIVEDLPIGVAMVGGVVSHISLVLAENFETVFTIPSGAPAPWESPWPGMGFGSGEGGMNSPLRMLLATRAIFVGDGDTYLTSDLAYFIRDCTGAGFDWDEYHASPKKITYLIENHAAGTTVIFDPVLGDFRPLTCTNAENLLGKRLDEFFKDDRSGRFNQLVCANVETPPEYAGTDIACGDGALDDAYNRLMPELSASGAQAADFMKDLMLSSMVRATIGCGAPVNEESFRLCLTTMTDAIEQSRVQNAAAASGFQKIMIPAMNMFLFLFYAMSPLIAVVIAASGMMGLSIAGKYMLFGVWAHSWLPVAVVIDYFMEASVKQELHNFSTAYLNGNFDGTRFYDILADHISVASDLLAATPLVTLAIISGSMYSITSVAGRMGTRDHVDETKAAPTTLKQNPLMTNSYDSQSYAGVGSGTVAQRGGQVSLLSDQAQEQSHRLDASMVRSAGQAFAQQQSAHFQRASEQALQQGTQELGQALQRLGNSTTSSTEDTAAYQQLQSTGREWNQRYGTSTNLSDAAAAVLGATLSGSFQGKLGGDKNASFALAKMLSAQAGLSAEDRQQVATSLTKGFETAESNGVNLKSGADAKFTQSVKEGTNAIREMSASAARSFSDSASLSDKASTSVAEVDQWTRDVGTQGRLANGQSARIAPMLQNAMLTDGSLAGRMVEGISSAVAGMVSKANAAGADGTALGTAFNNKVQAHDDFLKKNGQFQAPQQRQAMAMLEALASVASGGVVNKNNEPGFANAALGQVLKEFAPQLNLGAGSGNAGLDEQVQGRIGAAGGQVPGRGFGAEVRAQVTSGRQALEEQGNRVQPPAGPGGAADAYQSMTGSVVRAHNDNRAQTDASPGATHVTTEINKGQAYLHQEAGDTLRRADAVLGVAKGGVNDLLNAAEGGAGAAYDFLFKPAPDAGAPPPPPAEANPGTGARRAREMLNNPPPPLGGPGPGQSPPPLQGDDGKKNAGTSLGPTSARVAANIKVWNQAISRPQGEEYASLVADEAVRQGVDPYLAVAVAAAESQLNPNAGSDKNAVGLMQLIPDTAADLGLKPEERTDPAKNARAGVRYLAQLLRKHDGNETLALASYNAGPGVVAKYGNTVPPYPETQTYVARVTDIAQHLRSHAARQS